MSDFADLYQWKRTGRSWIRERTPEQLDWLQELAAHIREAGREPSVSWRELNRRFDKRWPGEAPKDASKLADAVRRMV